MISEPDRQRLKAQRIREAKLRVEEFLNLNLSLAEQIELIDDLYQHVPNDLRKKAWHKDARR
jgi:transposase